MIVPFLFSISCIYCLDTVIFSQHLFENEWYVCFQGVQGGECSRLKIQFQRSKQTTKTKQHTNEQILCGKGVFSMFFCFTVKFFNCLFKLTVCAHSVTQQSKKAELLLFYLSVCRSVCLFTYLSTDPRTHPPTHPPTYIYTYLPTYLLVSSVSV